MAQENAPVCASALTDRGMQKVCIAGYTNFTGDLAHPDIPNREFQIRHIAELARVAHDLGAGTIRVFTGYLEPATPFQRHGI